MDRPTRALTRLQPLHLAALVAALFFVAALAPAPALAITADEYEAGDGDDTFSTATPITTNGTGQQHTIYPEGDADWVSFAVTSGWTYRVETTPGTLGDAMESVALDLYDANGTTQLDYGQGYYYAEYVSGDTYYPFIEFTADASKTIYTRVDGSTGAYALSVTVIGSSDAFEPDDSYGAAGPITVDAAPQQHSIYPSDDQDWVSFSFSAGWKYTIQTAQGTPADADTDLGLALYDSDGTSEIAVETYDYYPSIEHIAKASKRVYVRVWDLFGSGGTYTLRVTAVPVPVISAPDSVDFGNVVVGATQRRTITVRNTGAAPLTVSDVQLTGSGFSIVRNEAAGSSIPVGGSLEVEVQYAPTVGYGGAPSAVKHDWTNQLVQYNYSGGSLISHWLFTGFQNVGGPGNLAWRLKCGATEKTGSVAVVAGGRYTIRTVVYAGLYSSQGRVELTQPVAAAWDFPNYLGSLGAVTYLRVPDGTLTIQSSDTENPTVTADLLGSATKKTDLDNPTCVDNAPSGWVKKAVTVTLTPADTGGSGIDKTQYRLGDWPTWLDAIGNRFTVTGNGVHSYQYRALDNAGNASQIGTCRVRIDGTRPVAKARKNRTVKRGRKVRLDYRINDRYSPKAKTVRIKIYRGKKRVKTITLRNRTTNKDLSFRFRCKLKKGRYVYKVSAIDLAGNVSKQTKASRRTLRVR